MRCAGSDTQQEPGAASVILRRRQVRSTRKAHECSDCGREIPARSVAWVTAALTDGEFWSGYQHTYDGACIGREK